MPTRRQIEEAYNVARELCPGARIKGVGPDGVTFDYPDGKSASGTWENKPFSGEVA
jgi:hypothetical protein